MEELVLKESREDESGGWAGVHCESSLVMTLMMLLLWEEVFDPTVNAAGVHYLTVSFCAFCKVEFLSLPAGRWRWRMTNQRHLIGPMSNVAVRVVLHLERGVYAHMSQRSSRELPSPLMGCPPFFGSLPPRFCQAKASGAMPRTRSTVAPDVQSALIPNHVWGRGAIFFLL